MLRELAQITNPSLRERMERGLVGNMIKAKANLGLGLTLNNIVTLKSGLEISQGH